MSNEWYLKEYAEKKYLHDQILQLRAYPASSADHDHCELCWARFSAYEGDLHKGYYEENSHSWICGDCFRDFKNLFRWRLSRNTSD